jgi:hypothetical protein
LPLFDLPGGLSLGVMQAQIPFVQGWRERSSFLRVLHPAFALVSLRHVSDCRQFFNLAGKTKS